MDLLLVVAALAFVIWLYFRTNPLKHDSKFMIRRFVNWFPLGMSYAFLYFARYNLNVASVALSDKISNVAFGWIFAAGTFTYFVSLIFVGPLVDTIGGKKGIIIACLGACLANMAMALVTFLALKGVITEHFIVYLSILYAFNMFCQSYGAVSIIKVKSYWFHVRERGVFGAIFGTLISFGGYFAFDWGQAIVNAGSLVPKKELSFAQSVIRSAFAVESGTTNATWLVFLIPAVCLIMWALIDMIFIRDLPSQAGFEDFDTHDASSGQMDEQVSSMQLIKRILTHPVLLTVSFIEFTTGVTRNGIMQWYFQFSSKVPQVGAEFFKDHWGLLLCLTGITGGFLAGWLSDKFFHSRRAPVAGIMNIAMFVFCTTMAVILMTSPVGVGICAIAIFLTGIGVHSIMSGTAGADFGVRKAAATAAGITDAFVYLGTGFQSIALGYITSYSWSLWPVFLIPFTLLGIYLSTRIWKAIPDATKKYLASVEKVEISPASPAGATRVAKA